MSKLAQSGRQGAFSPGTLFGNSPSLFGAKEGIKILVLGLNPSGLTESAAEQIGLILQKNLNNTGHFSVVGPREMNAAFERDQKDLVDCREIACGVESGKVLGAERVLVGDIRVEGELFVLHVRVIDPANNLTDYEEVVQFDDLRLDEELFKLANSISRNSVLVGRVLSISIRGLVVSLGKKDGIKIGDRIVAYKIEVPINNLQGQQIDTQRKNTAIIKVLNVNENSSEATLVHMSEDPQVGQYIQTYLDPIRQITLVENTRKELDTNIRLANKIRPLELAPVLLADSERRDWQVRLAGAEAAKDLWLYTAFGGGLATAYSFNFFEESNIGRLRLYGSIGVASYGLWRFLQARDAVSDLILEGRSKGYVQLQFTPFIGPDSLGLQVALNW